MTTNLPSLEAQAARWRDLNESGDAAVLRDTAEWLVRQARSLGFRVEIANVSHACSMGATHEVVTVTPSRDGYQSTT